MKIGFSLTGQGLILAAIALAALPARGDTNHYAGSAWVLVDVKKAMSSSSEITPAKYPDCDEAIVEQKSVRVYQADGTGECQDETFVKVLTEKGKRDNRTLTMTFMLPYMAVAVAKLEVIKRTEKRFRWTWRRIRRSPLMTARWRRTFTTRICGCCR